jgi:predicted RND superfamily exporter protein
LNFSDSPPFHHFGNTVALGVIVAMALSLTVLPSLLGALPVREHRKSRATGLSAVRIGKAVVRHSKGFLWGVAALTLVLVSLIPRNELNENYVHYFDTSYEFRQATDFMVERITGLFTLEYKLSADSSGGIAEPEFLVQLDQFVEWLRRDPMVTHVNSISDTFKRLSKSMHGDDPSWYRLPNDRNLAA